MNLSRNIFTNRNFLIFILLLILILVFIFVSIFFINLRKENISRVVLGNKTFKVAIADTDLAKARGLSGHKPLGDNEGMLFVFDKSDKYGFWMKDMKFSIDIIWIDENWRVVHIEKNVTPETYPKIFFPQKPSLYVLEINTQKSDIFNIKIDDLVDFLKK